ncbi:MAG TPA: hypothetical protein VI278_12885 [Nitrososphaeraceae archaeon]
MTKYGYLMHIILAEGIRSVKFRGIEQNELGRNRLIDSTSVNIYK